MTTIYETIRKDFIQSRLKKDGMSAFYSTLIGEMDNEASRTKSGDKTVTDEVAIKVLKSFLKNLQENFKVEGGNNYSTVIEIHTVEQYLPSQMNEDDLRAAIKAHVESTGLNGIGDIMSFLKKNHAGLYDGKLASVVAKEFV